MSKHRDELQELVVANELLGEHIAQLQQKATDKYEELCRLQVRVQELDYLLNSHTT